VSGGDAPELFELVKEAFDEVALLVEIDVVGALEAAISLGRDDDLASGCAILSQRWSAS
jgi:hypothetical protein